MLRYAKGESRMIKSSRFLRVLIVALGVLLVGGNGIRGAAPTLAASTGQIYVSAGHRIVRVNNMSGAGQITLGTPGVTGANHFANTTGIFVDGRGQIYVADSNNDRIVRVNDMSGTGWITLGAPARFGQFNKPFISFNKPVGIFVDGAGRIYVADAGNGRIVRMDDMVGTGWTTLGTAGTGVNEFNNPDGVFVEEVGRIYVADLGNSRIVRMNDMTGAGWTTLGTQGAGVNQFAGNECVGGIFVDKAGRIYVADLKNNRIVRMNDMTGAGWTTLSISADGVNRFEDPRAIFVDGAGQIYVMDLTRIVRVNNMTGAGWTTLRAPAIGSGISVH
jgi:streptogramin lyase